MALLRSTPDPSVEKQLHDTACGAACIVMLAADRGIVLDQRPIADRILPRDQLPEALQRLGGLQADEFAGMLGEYTGNIWNGGPTNIEILGVERSIRALSEHGSWAALIGPHGKGHWVVIDRVSQRSSVHIRDPSGHRRRLSLLDFGKIWAPGYYAVWRLRDPLHPAPNR